MYKINPKEMDTSFRVPSSLVDKHIRLANEHQLKVLLWIMRNSPDCPDIDAMCKALKIKADDAYDYLQYWVLTGVLLCDDSPASEKQESKTANQVQSKQEIQSKPVTAVVSPVSLPVYTKPTQSEITARIAESPELSLMFREAQAKLGKTFGFDMQGVLLMLHDYDGLPFEVIYMLLDYCVSIGKTNNSYIATVGRQWGESEIDTIEKADEKITQLRCADSVWKDFAMMAGLSNPKPTSSQIKYLAKWNGTFGFSSEMIYLAYEEMADHTQKLSFAYMDKVLTNWYENSVKTPKQLETYKKAIADAKNISATDNQKQKDTQRGTSYDLDAFVQSIENEELRYERKKKK